MVPTAVTLAETAERCAVVHVVRHSRGLSLDELLRWAADGPYADIIGSIRVGELLELPSVELPRIPRIPTLQFPIPLPHEPIETSVIRIFEAHPGARFASSPIVHHLRLRRWTAQKILSALVERGVLRRSGKTSSTRYWLARD